MTSKDSDSGAALRGSICKLGSCPKSPSTCSVLMIDKNAASHLPIQDLGTEGFIINESRPKGLSAQTVSLPNAPGRCPGQESFPRIRNIFSLGPFQV